MSAKHEWIITLRVHMWEIFIVHKSIRQQQHCHFSIQWLFLWKMIQKIKFIVITSGDKAYFSMKMIEKNKFIAITSGDNESIVITSGDNNFV